MFKNMCVEKTIETALLLCYGVNEKSAQCFFIPKSKGMRFRFAR